MDGNLAIGSEGVLKAGITSWGLESLFISYKHFPGVEDLKKRCISCMVGVGSTVKALELCEGL